MRKSTTRGITLLEITIALGLWLILSSGVFLILQHSAQASAELMARQSAFENARGSMDVLVMNMQMARSITLTADSNDSMRELVLNQRQLYGGSWRWHNFHFFFDVTAPYGATRYQRLRFSGYGNEFARNIANVQIAYLDNSRMRIIITTACEEPIILESSVDVRYKEVTVIGGSN